MSNQLKLSKYRVQSQIIINCAYAAWQLAREIRVYFQREARRRSTLEELDGRKESTKNCLTAHKLLGFCPTLPAVQPGIRFVVAVSCVSTGQRLWYFFKKMLFLSSPSSSPLTLLRLMPCSRTWIDYGWYDLPLALVFGYEIIWSPQAFAVACLPICNQLGSLRKSPT